MSCTSTQSSTSPKDGDNSKQEKDHDDSSGEEGSDDESSSTEEQDEPSEEQLEDLCESSLNDLLEDGSFQLGSARYKSVIVDYNDVKYWCEVTYRRDTGGGGAGILGFTKVRIQDFHKATDSDEEEEEEEEEEEDDDEFYGGDPGSESEDGDEEDETDQVDLAKPAQPCILLEFNLSTLAPEDAELLRALYIKSNPFAKVPVTRDDNIFLRTVARPFPIIRVSDVNPERCNLASTHSRKAKPIKKVATACYDWAIGDTITEQLLTGNEYLQNIIDKADTYVHHGNLVAFAFGKTYYPDGVNERYGNNYKNKGYDCLVALWKCSNEDRALEMESALFNYYKIVREHVNLIAVLATRRDVPQLRIATAFISL